MALKRIPPKKLAAARYPLRIPPAAHAFAPLLACVCGALAIASAYDSRWSGWLDYRRDALADDLWRLVTAHLVHLSPAHAALNIVGLLLTAWIFADVLRGWRPAAVCLLSTLSIDLGLRMFHPEVERYAGLSGVLHGWFAAGAVCWMLSADRSRHDDTGTGPVGAGHHRAWGAVLTSGLIVKLLLESRQPAFWMAGEPFAVVTAAHRWGAAAGAACGVAGVATAWFRRRPGACERAA